MKAFVTGAGGFIGSHLCEALRDSGHEVTGMARYCGRDTFGWLDEVEGVRKVRGDVLDGGLIEKLAGGNEIIFHLAAIGSVPYSFDAPNVVELVNVDGTENVLFAAQRVGAKVVHLSTSEVYGTAQRVPMSEAHPIAPQSPYAESKVIADKLVAMFRERTYPVKTIIVRPFNVYGPRQSERAIVPAIIRQCLDERCEAIELGNLDSGRDLTYVRDTVAGIIAASKLDDIGPWHVGGGAHTTVHKLVLDIMRITGVAKDVVVRPNRTRDPATEVKNLECDASKLRKASGWVPRESLETGLRNTAQWFFNRPKPSMGYMV